MKVKEILNNELKEISPSTEYIKKLGKMARGFCKELESRGENIEVFIGGSLAKGTLLNKKKQDVDVFIRFPKNMTCEKIAKEMKKIVEGKKVKGSRDYFQIEKGGVIFEIVPVIKIEKPGEARNVTDLSYFHVDYVKDKIKKKPKLADEIRLAKHFAYCQDCYGAESYIQGFSGYALELLIIYYGSFIKFLKAINKNKNKIILDPSKHYKNKLEIKTELNEAKLNSPMVLIDPTCKKRNALAALSEETFSNFKVVSKEFLKRPSKEFFEKGKINSEDYNLIIKAKTDKQPGDIAGGKLKKFFRVLSEEIRKYFEIKDGKFEYEEGNNANFYFNLREKERILEGPPVNGGKNSKKFRRKHKEVYEKKGILYAKEKPISKKDFIKLFKKKYKEKINLMNITGLKILKSDE